MGGPVTPPAYQPLSLPTGSGLTSTESDVTLGSFQEIPLALGNYGKLTFASGNTVSLTAGEYVFADIVSSFSLNELSFDTSGGDVTLYNVDVTVVPEPAAVLLGAVAAGVMMFVRRRSQVVAASKN